MSRRDSRAERRGSVSSPGLSAEVFGEGVDGAAGAGDDASYLARNLRGARGPDDDDGDANKE